MYLYIFLPESRVYTTAATTQLYSAILSLVIHQHPRNDITHYVHELSDTKWQVE